MATVRRHRSKWQVSIRMRGIKPIWKSFAKRSDAIRWARAIEGEIATGTYVDPRDAERTIFADIVDHFSSCLDARGKTDPALISRLKRVRTGLGDFALSKLSTQQLAIYRDLRSQNVSSTTVAHELCLVRRLLNYANDEMGIILARKPKIPLPRLPRGRKRRLVADEWQRLLTACADDPQFQALIELAVETAMRRSELINIQPEHIDWRSSVLLIPKTKNGESRVIPLSPRARSILECFSNQNGPFTGLTATRASQKFACACRKAGISDLRLHDLRHEAISRFVERGFSTMEIAAVSGHETVSMLARYSHPSAETLAVKLAA